MQKWSRVGMALLLLGVSGTASAQLGLPGPGLSGPGLSGLGLPGLSDVTGRVGDTADAVRSPVAGVLRDAPALASARVQRLSDFVHANRASVEFDDADQPARAREVLLLDPDPPALTRAAAAGYRLIEAGEIDGLGITYARLATPSDTSLASATRQLRRLLPGKEISADQIHFASGAVQPGLAGTAAGVPPPRGGTVGIIDGGVPAGRHMAAEAGFAKDAPRPNAHAQAIVYGADPAGGSALAIAKALGWMVGKAAPVVSISLVGPANPLLAHAIAAVQAKGIIVVAPVGNDGAAAPPAYPASYRGVVAVTGIDGRGRVLFEAGRASHLDYAAPAADITAIGLDGKPQKLRGTSFAAPLVAARVAALGREGELPAAKLARADAEAVNRSARTGRGVLCGQCRRGI